MRQIEQMESEELLAQKKLRTEVIQLEDMLAQVSFSLENKVRSPPTHHLFSPCPKYGLNLLWPKTNRIVDFEVNAWSLLFINLQINSIFS